MGDRLATDDRKVSLYFTFYGRPAQQMRTLYFRPVVYSFFFFFMAALWNRAGHYIFILWFLLSSIFPLFFSPVLSRRRLDVYHTSTHGVALVRS